MHKVKFLIRLVIILFSFDISKADTFYLNKNEIPIDINFTGDTIELYGIKNDESQILITLKGEKIDYKIQKKEKNFGIWIGGKKNIVPNVYRYYAIFAETELLKLNISHLLKDFELGIQNISSNSLEKELEIFDFKNNLIQNKIHNNLFIEKYDAKIANSQNLVYTKFILPKNIPEGKYVVSVYQILDSNIISIHNIPLDIHQMRVLRYIKNIANNNKILYFALCIASSIGLPLFWYIIFNKTVINSFTSFRKKKTKKETETEKLNLELTPSIQKEIKKRGRPRKNN